MSTIVLTGASSGIGAVAAEKLAEQGWDVAVVGRDRERTGAVAAAVGGTAFLADYGRLDDVRGLAAALLDRYPRIDVLANNAGGMVPHRTATADGNERTLQVNYLAPFLLTNLLLPRIELSQGRVVSTASVAGRFGRIDLNDLNAIGRPYLGGWRAYGSAKLATILFARELANRSTVRSYSFHPGFVATRFGSESRAVRLGMALVASRQISAEVGAVPLIQFASASRIDAPNGTYFDGLSPDGAVARQAKDAHLATLLWDTTARIVGL